MNGLDLFSGIGGISLALREYVSPVAYCEIDRYAQAVLLSRMASNDIGRAPIWDDVTSLRGSMLPSIDIIYGGFPCQDISVAGNGVGLGGERSGLFYEIVRLTKEINPKFVFLENVPAIRTRGLRQCIGAFTDLRYDCRWTCVSAAEVGAPHLRKRWFMLAHSKGERSTERWNRGNQAADGEIFNLQPECGGQALAHAASAIREGLWPESDRKSRGPSDGGWWSTEPSVGRVANGVPHRVDRIKGLGNAVVPLQAETAFKRLMGLS